MNTTKKRGRPPKQRVEKPVQESQPESQEVKVEEPASAILQVVAHSACRNPTLIEARHDGKKLLIRVPKRIRDRLIGKMISIRQSDTIDGNATYEYVQQ
jgi:hypothetical protein